MTARERMLAVLRGEPADRMPWAPRLDLWHKANKQAGALPRGFENAGLMDITDAFGMGFHAIVPDFRDLRGPEDDQDRGLGVYNLRSMPYQTVFHNVRRSRREEGDRTIVEYETPHGAVSTVTVYDDAMRKAGVSITHIERHAIQDVKDFKAVGFLFENAEAVPQYEGYAAFARSVGERGLAAAFVSLAASPVHLMQRELMPLDQFFYAMHDAPDEMAEAAERIGAYWRKVMSVVAGCPAEVVFVGANYDAAVTPPPFFDRHIRPWLREWADLLHSRGKRLLTHTDGENTGLLQLYLASGVDIADSICPKPMTRLSLRQVREVFDGRITIMGGVPSVSLLEASMSDREFDRFLDAFFQDL
ncbi:MAG TPA: hypothetical protein P5137_11640, partial [Candidatus Brocadiia bacterium]|nr:hypothetical protein [Candidatus Brocadiia bacterium]